MYCGRIIGINKFCLILIFSFGTYVAAAQHRVILKPEVDFSYGPGFYKTVLPEGFAYNPISVLATVSLWRFGRFSAYSEWQFAQVQSPVIDNKAEYESGINAGLKFKFPVHRYFDFSIAVGAGPHYIPTDTKRQAGGFIFSDNFELGAYFNPSNLGWSFLLKGRFRHISNAGLKKPNGGINNGFLLFGVSKSF